MASSRARGRRARSVAADEYGAGLGLRDSSNGMWLSWIVYRGARRVTFTPLQLKTWQDTRTYANSPWSPPYIMPTALADGKWVVQATFDEPGNYVLRAVAGDGALFTGQHVTVSVTP